MHTTKGSLTDRLWTAFVPRRSELRRRSDRVETRARWVALVLLVVSVPFLLALGSARAQDVRDGAAAVRASASPVVATITQVVPRAATAGGVPSGAVDVTASWSGPDGAPHTVTGVELRGARVGDPWSAWVDAAGHQVRAPRTDGQATAEGVMLAGWLFLVLGLGLLAVLALLHRVLDRRRMADWDEDWALFRLGRGRGVTG
jgi:hypothetical protein